MNATPERPVMLLDIDGVLNLFPSYGITRDADELVTRQTARHAVLLSDDQTAPYRLSIPNDLPALVTQLGEHFDIHWYTMWNDYANRVFSPLAGLPEFPHFECDWFAGQEAYDKVWSPDWFRKYIWIAKTPLVPRYVGSRPFVWIDDDVTEVDTLWLEQHPAIGEFRIIAVKPHTGLTQAVVDEAIEWARSLTMQEEVAS
jgi:hypothetical protein